MVGTSQKWPAKAGGRSPKGPAVAGTIVLQLHARVMISRERNSAVKERQRVGKHC